MRGKVYIVLCTYETTRITPAYAGKRGKDKSREWLPEDHPCICGEKRTRMTVGFFLIGSPLHMRGKGCGQNEVSDRARITPAYAGKSAVLKSRRLSVQDHPCVCGEKILTDICIRVLQGSPLRMRGKDNIKSGAVERNRITPAYAGKRLQ